MAEEKKTEAAPPPADAAPAAPSAPKGPLIIALVNTLAILATFGFFYYARTMFKRPQITETAERAKIEAAKDKEPLKNEAVLVNFEPMTVNISPPPTEEKPVDGSPGEKNLHWVNIGFSLELREGRHRDAIEKLRPMIVDRVMSVIGRKTYDDLVTIQGRYHLRAEITEVANELMERTTETRGSAVSNVFLSQFMIQ